MRTFALLCLFLYHLSGPLTAQAPAFGVARLAWVAWGSGVRDNPAVLAGDSGVTVFWEESPGLDQSGAPAPPYRIMRRSLDSRWVRIGAPAPFVASWGNQWGAAALSIGGRRFLAYYFADRSMRTGDRDIELRELDPLAERTIARTRITRDPEHVGPTNDASPALAADPMGAGVLVAYSSGVYNPAATAANAYRDKDIMLRAFDLTGREVESQALTDGHERGHEMTPAIAVWPAAAPLRILAYVSDSAAPGRYDLYLGVFGDRWQRQSSTRLQRGESGVAKPSLAVVAGRLFLSWHDNASQDVMIAEISRDLRVSPARSLRTLLKGTELDSLATSGAVLSGAGLFDLRNQLGVAFVATRQWDQVHRQARQDILLVLLQPR